MQTRYLLLGLFIAQANVVACGQTTSSSQAVSTSPGGTGGGAGASCVAPSIAASVAAELPWLRLRLPEPSAQERLVILKATETGFLVMFQEQLGTDAKAVQSFRHRLFLSSDGVTWEEHPGPPTETANPTTFFNGAAHGATRLVAVGGSIVGDDGGAVWSAADDGVWQPANITADFPLSGIEWTSSGFLVFGDGGTVLTSADGLEWTKESYPAAQIRTVACSASTCVFGATTNFVVLDRQSRQWSVTTLDCSLTECVSDPSGNRIPPPVRRVLYGHGEFRAETEDVGMGSMGFVSTDGSTWSRVDLDRTPQAFIRGLALRASGPKRVDVWNEGETPRMVPVTDDNDAALNCSAFDCVVVSDSDFSLMLIPNAPKTTNCD